MFLNVNGLSPKKEYVKNGKIRYDKAKNIILADHVLLKYTTKFCHA